MQINYWAVLVAAIVSMVVGMIWYGPLFGKKFKSAMGMDSMSPEQMAMMKKGMTMKYVWQFIASLVMFYVLAAIIGFMGPMSAMSGIMAAFWVWIGFVVPIKLSDALWGGKMSMFWLSIGNMLVTLLLAGWIIGMWTMVAY